MKMLFILMILLIQDIKGYNVYNKCNHYYGISNIRNKNSISIKNSNIRNKNIISINNSNIAIIDDDKKITATTTTTPTPTTPTKTTTNKNNTNIIKYISLLVLLLQNCSLAILMRKSRLNKPSSLLYITSTAVVCSEIIKFICSIILETIITKKTIKNTLNIIQNDINNDKKHMLKITIPSLLYVIQNNLQYIAMSNLPSGLYQIFSQTKIISTAIFSFFLLKRKQKVVQWLSVIGITIGTILAQLSPNSIIIQNNTNLFLGFISVILMSLTSGYAGVFVEKTLKEKNNRSIWLNNTYMAGVSLIFALINCIKDYKVISIDGFFRGYNDPLVFTTIFIQALGGLLVSLVVRQTDSVTKGIAASGSVILSCLISSLILKEYSFNINYFISAFFVTFSSYCYATAHRTDDIDFGIDFFKYSQDKLKDTLPIWSFLYGYELFPKNKNKK